MVWYSLGCLGDPSSSVMLLQTLSPKAAASPKNAIHDTHHQLQRKTSQLAWYQVDSTHRYTYIQAYIRKTQAVWNALYLSIYHEVLHIVSKLIVVLMAFMYGGLTFKVVSVAQCVLGVHSQRCSFCVYILYRSQHCNTAPLYSVRLAGRQPHTFASPSQSSKLSTSIKCVYRKPLLASVVLSGAALSTCIHRCRVPLGYILCRGFHSLQNLVAISQRNYWPELISRAGCKEIMAKRATQFKD